MKLKYGVNPHQRARILGASEALPFDVVHGDPSFINILDALNGWTLVRDIRSAIGKPAAASFKHVSPAGIAVSGPLDAVDIATSGVDSATGVASAYVRARDCDPRSSFGDMIAVSDTVDAELADFLSHRVSDGIIAPSFDPGTVSTLARKKRGSYLILCGKVETRLPTFERRDVLGVTVEQERDSSSITVGLFTDALPQDAIDDCLLAMYAVRYTQSNSVAFVRGGRSLGIGAGQQSRVDCTRLAAGKTATWWARRHEFVASLGRPDSMTRQDFVNWQMRLIENDLTEYENAELARLFGISAREFTLDDRQSWTRSLTGVTMASDGFLPFRDNVDHAGRVGTVRIVEPGGSIRSDSVAEACKDLGIDLVRTGLRLFHH